MISGTRLGVALDRARQRVAAERAEAHPRQRRLLARLERHAVVVDHDQRPVALDDRPLLREVERHDRDLLAVDVVPDVELGPVREREDADRLALVLARVVEPPELRAAGSSGPSGAARERNEKIRSLARDLSSSRRAPPNAASKPYASSACLSASVFITSVWTAEPCVNGLMPCREALAR